MMLNMQEGFGLAFNVLEKNSEYLSGKVFHSIKNSVYHFLVNILKFHEYFHRLHHCVSIPHKFNMFTRAKISK